MKDTDFAKLVAATTAQPFETEALFFNKVLSFRECLTKEHIYRGKRAQALDIYNSNGKSTKPNIRPTAAVIDPSTLGSAKAAVAAKKIFEEFSFPIGLESTERQLST